MEEFGEQKVYGELCRVSGFLHPLDSVIRLHLQNAKHTYIRVRVPSFITSELKCRIDHSHRVRRSLTLPMAHMAHM